MFHLESYDFALSEECRHPIPDDQVDAFGRLEPILDGSSLCVHFGTSGYRPTHPDGPLLGARVHQDGEPDLFHVTHELGHLLCAKTPKNIWSDSWGLKAPARILWHAGEPILDTAYLRPTASTLEARVFAYQWRIYKALDLEWRTRRYVHLFELLPDWHAIPKCALAPTSPLSFSADKSARQMTVVYWIGKFFHELEGVDVLEELRTRLQWYDDAPLD